MAIDTEKEMRELQNRIATLTAKLGKPASTAESVGTVDLDALKRDHVARLNRGQKDDGRLAKAVLAERKKLEAKIAEAAERIEFSQKRRFTIYIPTGWTREKPEGIKDLCKECGKEKGTH